MNIIWKPNLPYSAAHLLMQEYLKKRINHEIEDTLLLCSHPPVYTIGRQKGSEQSILNAGEVPCVFVERGGNVTFHGPGQLVGYPIVELPSHKSPACLQPEPRRTGSSWLRS